MYLLIGIFAIIPLIFSHTFARFWADFIIDNGIGHFESLKMHLFLLLLLISVSELIGEKWKKWHTLFHGQYFKYLILWILIFSILGLFYYPHETYRDLLLGVWEKQHGLLLPFGLILLSIFLSLLEKSEMRKIGYAIIASGTFVALVALIEKAGYNIFTGGDYWVEWSWWDIRSTSTLGNPNYVAGYLLMVLPVVLSIVRRWEKYFLFALIALGILVTKSIIWLWILGIYILFLIGARLYPKKIYTLLPLIISTIYLSVYTLYHGSEKWLSLSSRFILMKHTLFASTESVIKFLFGNGPEAIIRYFGDIRAPEINAYFPSNMIIDSSHNIFIDILSMYGMIGVGLFLFVIFYRWKHLDHTGKIGLILWISFLSLNVFVISHMILIVYFLARTKQEKS